MVSPPLTTLLAVWALTAVSRLPPGALSLAAVRTGYEKGLRTATALLIGAFAAEVAVTVAMLAAIARVPTELLQQPGARRVALSLGLAAAAVMLLWPAPTARRNRHPGQASAAAAVGFGLALTTPGLWSWWATVGMVIVAGGMSPAGGLWIGTALAAGLATSHILLLVGIRFVTFRLPRCPDTLRLSLGMILLACAGLVAGLRLGPG